MAEAAWLHILPTKDQSKKGYSSSTHKRVAAPPAHRNLWQIAEWLQHNYHQDTLKMEKQTTRLNPSLPQRFCLILIFTLFLCVPGKALENGLARTPPMGWNSWNHFWCDINEQMIREMAEAMVSSGMKEAGYRYINIDDCWHGTRDENGYIQPDPRRFPGGMKALADYVHSKGLKLGIYSDAGGETCAGRPGSRGFEQKDAVQYASWGIDYLKYDWCNTDGQASRDSYALMGDCLKAAGRPVVFSLCEWGSTQPWSWAADIGNLWRTTGDIEDKWDSFTSILDANAGLAPHAGPGHWNDPDMLEVGNGGMNSEEYKAHFSLWCILAAPLITGNDLRTMSDATREILTNREVIAVDQDPAGIQGTRVRDEGDLEVWSKPLGRDGIRKAAVLLNRGPQPARITANWGDLGLAPGKATVRDLWAHTDRGEFENSFTAEVPSHGVVMLMIQGTPAPALSVGQFYLSDLNWSGASSGYGLVEIDMSNGELAAGDGHPIQLSGVIFPKGLGCHAPSEIRYQLKGAAVQFSAEIGIDDEVGKNGSVVFQLFGDNTLLYDSGLMTGTMASKHIAVEISGKEELRLVVNDGGDGISYDHCDWADARLNVVQIPNSSLFIPVVLSNQGAAGSNYSSELTLANRSQATLEFEAVYTGSLESSSGKILLTLDPGHQKVIADAILFLKDHGIPLPESGNRGGTLRLQMTGGRPSSGLAAVVRTTSAVPRGRAGLAYSAVPDYLLQTGAAYICGLRQNSADRSNVAFQHAGGAESGNINLRATLFSSELSAPFLFPELILSPGEFRQWNSILQSQGLSVASGFLKVERIEGTAPYYAYGVVNDQLTSDGSFLSPQPERPDAVPLLILPVLIETPRYSSELILTNWSSYAKTLHMTWISGALSAPAHRTKFTVALKTGEQQIIPDFVQYLRLHGVEGIGPSGDTYAGAVLVEAAEMDCSGIFLGSRISTTDGVGTYGTYSPAIPLGGAHYQEAWIFGLQQNDQNRTNLAIVNTGAVNRSAEDFTIDLFDAEGGQLVSTMEGIQLDAGEWRQWNNLLSTHAPGTNYGYARVRCLNGVNPFLAYAVVNDGAVPGERSSDGAFIDSIP
jgi:alpha-galactosidase